MAGLSRHVNRVRQVPTEPTRAGRDLRRREDAAGEEVDILDDYGWMREANMAVVRRLVMQVLGRGHVRLLPELIAAGHVSHLGIGDHYGADGVRIDIAAYHAALPDLEVTLDDLFADGDRVARRFTISGTVRESSPDAAGQKRFVVLRGIAIDRLADGRVTESWVHIDALPRILPDAGC
jgi:predicted ester cyclase